MKNYLYTGLQPLYATYRIVENNKASTQDMRLYKGEIFSLNENVPFVKSLIARGLLVESIIAPQSMSDKDLKAKQD